MAARQPGSVMIPSGAAGMGGGGEGAEGYEAMQINMAEQNGERETAAIPLRGFSGQSQFRVRNTRQVEAFYCRR